MAISWSRCRPSALLAAVAAVAFLAAACASDSSDQEDPDAGPSAGASPSSTKAPEDIPNVVGWNTDWSKRTIDLGELAPGLGASDPRDVIPPLDDPVFETVAQASEWLDDREPVALLQLDGETRAYPLRILTWHEIVNDEMGTTRWPSRTALSATARSASTGRSTARSSVSALPACCGTAI
jgi:hypothetical protein